MSTQPNALRLADWLGDQWESKSLDSMTPEQLSEVMQELRAQHELIQTLKAALEDCVEDSQAGIDNHIQTYGLNYRSQRLAAWIKQVADARSALAAAEANK